MGLDAFSGLILMISEAPDNLLKQILELTWPMAGNINMVVWTGCPLDLSSTACMCIRGYNWVKR